MPRDRETRDALRARRDIAIATQPVHDAVEEAVGPPEPFSPQADFMTQSVSNRARWPGADISCSEVSAADPETLTCHETFDPTCRAERAHGLVAEPYRGPPDGGAAHGIAEPYRDQPDDDGAAAHGDDVPRGLAFCRGADTVIEGFLCDESVVVSNACRKPTNSFDEFVCDDLKMQRAQWAILSEAWALVKAIGLALLRSKP